MSICQVCTVTSLSYYMDTTRLLVVNNPSITKKIEIKYYTFHCRLTGSSRALGRYSVNFQTGPMAVWVKTASKSPKRDNRPL